MSNNLKNATSYFEKAQKGYQKWSLTPLAKRAELLGAFAKRLESEKDALAETISKEVHKPLWESKTEVQSAIGKVQISIDAFRIRCPENIRALPQGRSITRHKPHGVALVLGPFNFPVHLPNGHIIPTLLAGNSVIFKPSELGKKSAEHYIKIAHEAGLPKDVLVLADSSIEVAQALLNEPINLVLFTGSYKVGKVLSEHFASKPEVILALEMGGNNPLVIGEITDFHAASYQTIQSAFITSGQRCTCARRLIVMEGLRGEAFLKELIHMTRGIKLGHWDDKQEPFMGPLVSEKAADHVVSSVDALIQKGAKPLYPLLRDKNDLKLLSPAIVDVTGMDNLPDEEIFGPVLQVIRVKDLKQAIQVANDTRFGLSAGIFSDSQSEYKMFFEGVKAGVINWNTPLTGASSYAPFGGVGYSGNGRPSALYAADYAAYPVASIESATVKIPGNLPPGLEGVKQ